ncbi:MAG: GNAT family N-acetyltransferase [Thiobacillus sp. 65-69]|jgi:GNAT superfamily N-acetyltransferase|nr:GNAT family N-acetyltransferase [Thiobacillus sp.]ODU91085.1 MAG: GNAT family N-acetyltransferase [Thiobacillus sp. SCN 65-179]OJW37987.1 MAG: GNAT family N-acetyltransferase [Thiobacillus sp. 65-69]
MNDTPRRIAPDDIDAIAALARQVWQATYPPLISQAQIDHMLAERYAAERMHDQLADPLHAWWIAGAPAAGFAHAHLDGPVCKLDKLYVRPDRQRHGLGAALLAAAVDWARMQGMARMRLQVNRGNAQAIRAYRKYGFAVVESRIFDIGNGFVMDDHVMELPL